MGFCICQAPISAMTNWERSSEEYRMSRTGVLGHHGRVWLVFPGLSMPRGGSSSPPRPAIWSSTKRSSPTPWQKYPASNRLISIRTAMARFQSGRYSVRTAEAVEARFKADSRAPTEHALLDDNGDKIGTERPEPRPNSPQEKSAKRESQDGELAKKTFLRAQDPIDYFGFHPLHLHRDGLPMAIPNQPSVPRNRATTM